MDDRIESKALAIEIDRQRLGTRVAGQVASIGRNRIPRPRKSRPRGRGNQNLFFVTLVLFVVFVILNPST
jgi:hypothetical protein